MLTIIIIYNFCKHSFVRHEKMQRLPKTSIANALQARFKQNSMYPKGLE